MQQPRSWRDLLGEVIENAVERQRIARALSINPITLIRWAGRQGRPRPHYRQKLIDAMPGQIRQDFAASMAREFPEDKLPAFEGEENTIAEIPSVFYGRIFSAYTSTPRSLRPSSIFTIILQQMLAHLDPDQEGMSISVIRCTQPPPGRPVRSLQEIVERGTPPFKPYKELQLALLGAESLAGAAVMQFSKRINQNLRETIYIPALRTNYEESAMACPLAFEGCIAGCLLVASTQVNYFTARREQLVQDYTNLMVLGFQPEDFYEHSRISLEVMPSFEKQQPLFKTFRSRVMEIKQRPGNSHLSEAEVESIAFQEFEQLIIQQM
jgi:hypothetical protein